MLISHPPVLMRLRSFRDTHPYAPLRIHRHAARLAVCATFLIASIDGHPNHFYSLIAVLACSPVFFSAPVHRLA